MPAQIPFVPSKRPRLWWQLFVLLAVMVMARVAFIAFMPATYSTDLHSWLRVMDVLQAGGNPYKETGVLNWPPFWMQILFGLHHLAKLSGASPIHLIQSTLIIAECMVLCVAFTVASRFFNSKAVFPAMLFGLAINPASIFLSCQHCNYDVFVGLFVLLAAWMLMEWHRRLMPEAWLAACFFIGMGILAKTVPIIMTPLLLLGFRRLSVPVRLFGVLLLAAPFTIGMSVLFTLEPHGVMEHVVGYRSLAGWYGITGLFFRAGWNNAMEWYQKISPLLFLVMLGSTAYWCCRKVMLDAVSILVLALLVLIFIPTFGPGFSPPYVLWYLPLAAVLFTGANKSLRRLLLAGLIIISATYTVEYALFDSHGAFLKFWYPSDHLNAVSDDAARRAGQTIIRLPMFLCYLLLFRQLIRNLKTVTSTDKIL